MTRSRTSDRAETLSIEVVLDRNSGVRSDKVATYRAFLQDALAAAVHAEAYPRCTLVVAVRCLRDDGSTLAALVNVAFVALLDAGVEMTSLPVATGFCWKRAPGDSDIGDGGVAGTSKPTGELLVDPDSSEEAVHASVTVLCASGAPHSPLALHAVGLLDRSVLPLAFHTAAASSRSFAAVLRQKNTEMR